MATGDVLVNRKGQALRDTHGRLMTDPGTGIDPACCCPTLLCGVECLRVDISGLAWRGPLTLGPPDYAQIAGAGTISGSFKLKKQLYSEEWFGCFDSGLSIECDNSGDNPFDATQTSSSSQLILAFGCNANGQGFAGLDIGIGQTFEACGDPLNCCSFPILSIQFEIPRDGTSLDTGLTYHVPDLGPPFIGPGTVTISSACDGTASNQCLGCGIEFCSTCTGGEERSGCAEPPPATVTVNASALVDLWVDCASVTHCGGGGISLGTITLNLQPGGSCSAGFIYKSTDTRIPDGCGSMMNASPGGAQLSWIPDDGLWRLDVYGSGDGLWSGLLAGGVTGPIGTYTIICGTASCCQSNELVCTLTVSGTECVTDCDSGGPCPTGCGSVNSTISLDVTGITRCNGDPPADNPIILTRASGFSACTATNCHYQATDSAGFLTYVIDWFPDVALDGSGAWKLLILDNVSGVGDVNVWVGCNKNEAVTSDFTLICEQCDCPTGAFTDGPNCDVLTITAS